MIFIIMEYTNIYYLHKGDNIPFYIGKTNRSLISRLSNHKIRLKLDFLKIELIDKVYTDEWKFWESYWIEQFKVWGFNLDNKNKGGGGSTFLSESTKLKIKLKIKNHPTRGKKISKSNMGKTHSNKGKPFTEEHKQKIKSTRDFLKTRKNTWQNTPVLQYDLQGNFIQEWDSQKEASAFLKIKGDGVGACCRKKQKSAYGFIWKFKTN